jgi:membrane-associated protein
MPTWFTDFVTKFRYYYSPDGLQQLVAMGGVPFLIGIIFAETGLLIGFFLPGDSLLVVAGLLVEKGTIPLPLFALLGILIAAAILGDWVNFWMGARAGSRAWNWPDGRLFKHRHLVEAQQFYHKYGGLAIALCRFVPIARTFVPFIAGVSRMKFRHFMAYNAIGGSAWVTSMLCLGFWLGKTWLAERVDLVVLIVVAISVVPLAVAFIKRRLSSNTKCQRPTAE